VTSDVGALHACITRYRDALGPEAATADGLDRIRGICENMLAAQFRLETLATGQDIYANQLYQTTIVLWMVVTITLSGVVLAALQLWATYRLAMEGKGAIADGGEATIEYNRLVVRSSAVGVVILALSFAFFAIYVLYVYRITDLPGLETVVEPLRPAEGAQEIPR
jgi:hypothetical protein